MKSSKDYFLNIQTLSEKLNKETEKAKFVYIYKGTKITGDYLNTA